MLIEFDRINEPDKLGNKGIFLCVLRSSGFNVPDGFVLDSDTYDEFINASGLNIRQLLDGFENSDINALCSKVADIIDLNGAKKVIFNCISGKIDENTEYAVRSSSTKEDTGTLSFAGQYETFLNVKGTQKIVDAVINCYKSLFSPTVLSYLSANGIDAEGLKMAVVIQKMVHADYSGVAFTVNPISGNDKTIIIEAVKGLGESLVGGKAKPERYSCGWYDGINTSAVDNKLISPDMLREMSDTFLGIQMKFGYPCDIEFAVENGVLYILQARAITRIGYSGIEDVWSTADFKDGGVSAYVCTPYMWSLYEYIWEYALKKFILDSKILRPSDVDKKVGDMFYGRPYWNMTTVKKAMSSVPGYKEREFDSEYGVKITYEGDGDTTGITPSSLIKIAGIALAQRKILKERDENAEHYKRDLLAKYSTYRYSIDDEMSDKEFIIKWYKLTKADYLYSESTYFRQIFINTIHQALYKDGLLKYVSESDYLGLLSGIDNISHLLPFYEMWETTRKIRADKSSFDYWQNNQADMISSELDEDKFFLGDVREFIEKYGYHSDRELDVSYPCYCEDTKTVVAMFRDSVMLDDSCSPVDDKERQRQQYLSRLKMIKKKVSSHKFKKIKAKVEKMRNMLWWREEFRDVSTRFYCVIRLYTLRLSKILAADGTLEKADDIWMLKVGDLWNFFDERISPDELRSIVSKNRKYYNSFSHYTSDNEIGCVFDKESKQTVTKKDGFFGLGCNNGSVTATARVVESLDDIGRLRHGDILITKYTDTGWTCKFAMLSGIVTEYGGILCHAAIVSREYGIPCIVCAVDAMKKIKDGSTITINGTTGEIIAVKDKQSLCENKAGQ